MPPLPDLPLSVLDLAPVVSGSNPHAALRASVELAGHVDSLGYHRFWSAEHHNMPHVASAAPSIIAGRVASTTSRIRVGSGGVMLNNHHPLTVAEQFGTLAAFHPNRVDLGIGRASGTSTKVAELIRGAATDSEPFTTKLANLCRYIDSGESDGVRAVPVVPGKTPQVWLLGTTEFSAKLAGSLGLPYCYAHHLQPSNLTCVPRCYRDSFIPSARWPRPYLMVSTAAIAADDEVEARRLAGPMKLKYLRRKRGIRGLLPSVEEAARHQWSPEESAIVDARFCTAAIGSPEVVGAALQRLVHASGADELMITTQTGSLSDRMRSYELVAGLGLTGSTASARHQVVAPSAPQVVSEGHSEPGESRTAADRTSPISRGADGAHGRGGGDPAV